jgi:hypothetical protein
LAESQQVISRYQSISSPIPATAAVSLKTEGLSSIQSLSPHGVDKVSSEQSPKYQKVGIQIFLTLLLWFRYVLIYLPRIHVLKFHFCGEVLRGCQWLMPVILATWEAEIGRTVIQGQPGQTVHEAPSPK